MVLTSSLRRRTNRNSSISTLSNPWKSKKNTKTRSEMPEFKPSKTINSDKSKRLEPNKLVSKEISKSIRNFSKRRLLSTLLMDSSTCQTVLEFSQMELQSMVSMITFNSAAKTLLTKSVLPGPKRTNIKERLKLLNKSPLREELNSCKNLPLRKFHLRKTHSSTNLTASSTMLTEPDHSLTAPQLVATIMLSPD